MGPRHIQGHGHADALSFVLYGRGRLLIADPGVFSYHNKFWRDHFRNTMAHNTVTVDNQDQCVFWGPFRVAYPPKARLLESSDNHVVGEHEGYTRFSRPVIHRRRIERWTTSEWEILDQFEGRGEHEFSLNLQFAPGANAQVSGVNGEARWPDGNSLQVNCVTPPEKALACIEPGWVSPGWNLKEKRPGMCFVGSQKSSGNKNNIEDQMSFHHPLALVGRGLVRGTEINEREIISGESGGTDSPEPLATFSRKGSFDLFVTAYYPLGVHFSLVGTSRLEKK